MLGHEVTKAYGGQGLPDGTIDITFDGLGGQQLRRVLAQRHHAAGATATPTTTSARACRVDALVVRPPDDAPPDYVAEDNIIGGNVILFGATSGQAFLRGVGRRAVRRAQLRRTRGGRRRRRPRLRVHDRRQGGDPGRAPAATSRAGMSGGIAYVYDPEDALDANLNAEMVDLEELDADDLDWLHGIVAGARRRHRFGCGPTDSGRLGQRAEALRQGDAARLQAGAGGDRRGRAQRRPDRRRRRSWRPPVADPEGFPQVHPPRDAQAPAGAVCACTTGTRSTRDFPHSTTCSTRRAAAWTAESRSATTVVRWAT